MYTRPPPPPFLLQAHADLVLATQNPLPAELSVPGEDRPPAEQDLQCACLLCQLSAAAAAANAVRPCNCVPALQSPVAALPLRSCGCMCTAATHPLVGAAGRCELTC